MRILVTGASGYIGRNLVPHLREHGHTVIASDLGIGNDTDYIKSDVRYAPDVFYAVSESKPDVVMHLAGEVGIDNGEAHAHAMYDVNVIGALNVARACERLGARMVSFSTSDVFGRLFDNKIAGESDVVGHTDPQNTYAASKLAGEMVVRQEIANSGLDACILRPFMVYGPGEPPSRFRSAMVRFCYAAVTGEPFTVHEGTERAWCHIEDFCDGARLVAEKGECGGVYHIGGRGYHTLETLGEMIVEAAGGGSFNIVPMSDRTRASRKRFYMHNAHALGYNPRVPIQLGIQTVIDYLRG